MEAQEPQTDSNGEMKKEDLFFYNKRRGKHKFVTQNWLRDQPSHTNAFWGSQRKNNSGLDDPTTSVVTPEEHREIKKPLKPIIRTGAPARTISGVRFVLPQENIRRTELSYMDRIRRFCKRPLCIVILVIVVYVLVPCTLICVMIYFLTEWRSKKKSTYRGKLYG